MKWTWNFFETHLNLIEKIETHCQNLTVVVVMSKKFSLKSKYLIVDFSISNQIKVYQITRKSCGLLQPKKHLTVSIEPKKSTPKT